MRRDASGGYLTRISFVVADLIIWGVTAPSRRCQSSWADVAWTSH